MLVLCISCEDSNKRTIGPEYELEFSKYSKSIDDGRVKYLQLAGLFKFNGEQHNFGSAQGNSFLIESPSAAETIGTFRINPSDSIIEFTSAKDLEIKTADDAIVQSVKLILDESGSSRMLYNGDLKWQVITRSGSQYLRVWDKNHPMVKRFNGYEKYPLSDEFIFDGEFTYYETSQQAEVPSQLGVNAKTTFIGSVKFEYRGEPYELQVGQNGFTMVMDETSGNDTYGGGRYIYLELPESNGPVEIDFNRLYNPPCSFSQFTTCLYPPQDNHLPFDLNAGEMISRL